MREIHSPFLIDMFMTLADDHGFSGAYVWHGCVIRVVGTTPDRDWDLVLHALILDGNDAVKDEKLKRLAVVRDAWFEARTQVLIVSTTFVHIADNARFKLRWVALGLPLYVSKKKENVGQ